jgi:hypothetical protein
MEQPVPRVPPPYQGSVYRLKARHRPKGVWVEWAHLAPPHAHSAYLFLAKAL